MQQQIKVSLDQPDSPLLCIDKGLFGIDPKPSSVCTIADFRSSHGMEAGEHNIFLKIKKVAEEIETQDVLDVILEDKVSFVTLCYAAYCCVLFYR